VCLLTVRVTVLHCSVECVTVQHIEFTVIVQCTAYLCRQFL